MEKLKLVSEELALREAATFLTKYAKQQKQFPEDKVKDEYPGIFDAICSGNLVITDGKPVYKLTVPIVAEDAKNNINEISFRTRITPSSRADLADGLNLKTQAAKFSLRLIAYIIQQPTQMLDRFDADDYDVISEISAVFMAGGR